VHGVFDHPGQADVRIVGAPWMALSAGTAIGVGISIALLQLKILPMSFLEGDLMEFEREELERESEVARSKGEAEPEIPPELTPQQVRLEMRKEMLFLIPPMLMGGISMAVYLRVPALRNMWDQAATMDWLAAMLGSLLGGLVGGFVVWLFRILGSDGFGREAMGLGDVHLMFGVGAVLGGGAATVAFFLAPFFGILVVVYMLVTSHRRQLPLGPYLSMATAFLMLFYCPIAAYLQPGLRGLLIILRQAISGTA
jgi:leader peptidase (prepilin peptidase) / N-methyltransferase